MSFLDESTWHASVYSGGWVKAAGEAAVTVPATGAEIGRIGIADAEDVARAARRAAEAQRAWAARPYLERAAVLRRAGQLWEAHASDVGDWLVREAGSIPPKAGVETETAAQECCEAAALASHSLGEIIPSGSRG